MESPWSHCVKCWKQWLVHCTGQRNACYLREWLCALGPNALWICSWWKQGRCHCESWQRTSGTELNRDPKPGEAKYVNHLFLQMSWEFKILLKQTIGLNKRSVGMQRGRLRCFLVLVKSLCVKIRLQFRQNLPLSGRLGSIQTGSPGEEVGTLKRTSLSLTIVSSKICPQYAFANM